MDNGEAQWENVKNIQAGKHPIGVQNMIHFFAWNVFDARTPNYIANIGHLALSTL